MVSITAGFYIYSEGYKKSIENNIEEVIVTGREVEDEVVPEKLAEKYVRSDFNITVLNGSEKSGEALKVKNILTDEGFLVGSIGNAENSDYRETIIKVSKDIPSEYPNDLKNVLESRYNVQQKVV